MTNLTRLHRLIPYRVLIKFKYISIYDRTYLIERVAIYFKYISLDCEKCKVGFFLNIQFSINTYISISSFIFFIIFITSFAEIGLNSI